MTKINFDEMRSIYSGERPVLPGRFVVASPLLFSRIRGEDVLVLHEWRDGLRVDGESVILTRGELLAIADGATVLDENRTLVLRDAEPGMTVIRQPGFAEIALTDQEMAFLIDVARTADTWMAESDFPVTPDRQIVTEISPFEWKEYGERCPIKFTEIVQRVCVGTLGMEVGEIRQLVNGKSVPGFKCRWSEGRSWLKIEGPYTYITIRREMLAQALARYEELMAAYLLEATLSAELMGEAKRGTMLTKADSIAIAERIAEAAHPGNAFIKAKLVQEATGHVMRAFMKTFSDEARKAS